MKLYRIYMIVALATLSGCATYDYGVKKDDPQLLKFSNSYSGWEKGEYQFWSLISATPHIDIYHAATGLTGLPDSEIIESILNVGGLLQSADVTVISIVLEHRDKSNNLIIPTKKEWDALPTPPSVSHGYFKNIYNASDFPKEVIEIIKIELKKGDETEVLEYRFPLELKPSGSVWDVIMSV